MLALNNIGNFLLFHIVEDDIAILGAAHDVLVVWRNAKLCIVGTQLEQVVLECLKQLHLTEVPNLDGVVLGSAHDVLFVRSHTHASHWVGVCIVNLEAVLLGLGVPNLD